MIRFLHSGDWQLGMTRSVLGDEAQARFADARIAVVSRLGELARAQRCDFALVCGDVFESSQIERRTLARAFEAIASIPVPVYLLPGNHDPLDAASVYRSAAFRDAAPDHVHVLGDASPRAASCSARESHCSRSSSACAPAIGARMRLELRPGSSGEREG